MITFAANRGNEITAVLDVADWREVARVAFSPDNPPVLRRLHTQQLSPGIIELSEAEAHHARDVLRLEHGTEVELFDDAGQTAHGRIEYYDGSTARVVVRQIVETPGSTGVRLTVVAAVPKGDRADWMIEKLSELGVADFIPLAAARSVVLPEGKNKRDRWTRIATEAAKQSRRAGVMKVGELLSVNDAIKLSTIAGWVLSTQPGTVPIALAVKELSANALFLFIGPEGGWTDAELAAFAEAGLTSVALTDTILRVETAAVAAAAVVACSTKM